MTDLLPTRTEMGPSTLESSPSLLEKNTVAWWKDDTLVYLQKVQLKDKAVERYSRLRALWVRVIIRAAFDLASHKDDRKLMYRKYADDADRWLFQKSHLFNSFVNICAMLDIDPAKFRNWAKGLTKDEVRKMEHMERTSNNIRPMSDEEIYDSFHRRFRR